MARAGNFKTTIEGYFRLVFIMAEVGKFSENIDFFYFKCPPRILGGFTWRLQGFFSFFRVST